MDGCLTQSQHSVAEYSTAQPPQPPPGEDTQTQTRVEMSDYILRLRCASGLIHFINLLISTSTEPLNSNQSEVEIVYFCGSKYKSFCTYYPKQKVVLMKKTFQHERRKGRWRTRNPSQCATS